MIDKPAPTLMAGAIELHADGGVRYYELRERWVHPKPDRRLAPGSWRSATGFNAGHVFAVHTRYVPDADMPYYELHVYVAPGDRVVATYWPATNALTSDNSWVALSFLAAMQRSTSSLSQVREALQLWPFMSHSNVLLEVLGALLGSGKITVDDMRAVIAQIECEEETDGE